MHVGMAKVLTDFNSHIKRCSKWEKKQAGHTAKVRKGYVFAA
jgi:hypothetical protein